MWLPAAVACWLLLASEVASQRWVSPAEVTAMFPGLGDLRNSQEVKLRELLSQRQPSRASQPSYDSQASRDNRIPTIQSSSNSQTSRDKQFSNGQTSYVAQSGFDNKQSGQSSRNSQSIFDSQPQRGSQSTFNGQSGSQSSRDTQSSSNGQSQRGGEIAFESDNSPNSRTGTRVWSYTDTTTTRSRTTPRPMSQYHREPPPPPPPPAIDESREPITNKPPPVWDVRQEEQEAGSTADDYEPDVRLGPDQQSMSASERRRHVRTAERKCAEYEEMETRRVSALPLLPSAAPVSVRVPSCKPRAAPLVVGGEPVSIQQHPHAAALGWRRARSPGYAFKCGGSLVSDRYVLTAAHCASLDRDTTVLSGPPRVVQLGGSVLEERGAVLARVSSVIRHPRYRPPAAYHDLALLQLARPLTFTERVRPACVASADESVAGGGRIVATGWGRTEFGGETSRQLRGVELPLWPLSECARALGTSRKLPRGPDEASQICAGEPSGGKDTCQGDSGGGAAIGARCVWRVVGVTSLGRACGAPDTPALYARADPAFVASVVWPDD